MQTAPNNTTTSNILLTTMTRCGSWTMSFHMCFADKCFGKSHGYDWHSPQKIDPQQSFLKIQHECMKPKGSFETNVSHNCTYSSKQNPFHCGTDAALNKGQHVPLTNLNSCNFHGTSVITNSIFSWKSCIDVCSMGMVR